jgi:hypothetical protein
MGEWWPEENTKHFSEQFFLNATSSEYKEKGQC